MSESYWGTFIISVGVVILGLIFFIQRVTNTNEQNYTLVKETVEAAMYDAIDYSTYRLDGKTIRINREKFVENFVRRFADNATLSNEYIIEIYDVNEDPPKVSLIVKTKEGGVVANKEYTFNINNKVDAILETTF